jgi:hypothetical protein
MKFRMSRPKRRENQHANHPRKPDQSAPNNSRIARTLPLSMSRGPPAPTLGEVVVDRPQNPTGQPPAPLCRPWLLGHFSFLTLRARGYRPSDRPRRASNQWRISFFGENGCKNLRPRYATSSTACGFWYRRAILVCQGDLRAVRAIVPVSCRFGLVGPPWQPPLSRPHL